MVDLPALIPFVPLIAAGVSGAVGLYSGHQAAKQNQVVQGQMQATQNKQLGYFDQANALIPGMQNLAGQYGAANQGYLGDRAQLAQLNSGYGELDGKYGGLMDQMQRLYSQNGGDGGAAAGLMGNAAGVLGATDPSVYQRQAQLAGNDAMGQLSSQLAGRGIASSGTTSRLGASTLSRLYANSAAQGQQDRLNAYGISNNAMSQAGNLSLQAGQQHQGILGMIGNMIGQRSGLLGQAQQGVLAGSGLLGNYLGGMQNQFGMQQGMANQYMSQAGALGGMYNQQASQVNQNPYGGAVAGLGAFGTAAAQYQGNQQQQQWMNNQHQPLPPQYQPYVPYGGNGYVPPKYGTTYNRQ